MTTTSQSRQAIDGGGWFDPTRARTWKESTHWDGLMLVSGATGSGFDHEQLYRTPRGVYILNAWSDWQGGPDTYTRIDAAEASAWLVRMGHDPETAAECAAVAVAEV